MYPDPDAASPSPHASPTPAAYPPPPPAAPGAYPPPVYPPPASLGAPWTTAPAPTTAPTALAGGLFAAAVVTLVGLVTHGWFDAGRGAGAGLTGMQACMRDACQSISWGDVPRIPSDIVLFGYGGMLAGLAAVAVACAMGGMLLAGKAARIPVKAFNLVLGVAAFATTMFAMRLYSEEPKHLSWGYSGFLAIGGIIAIGTLTKQGVMKRVAAAA